MAIIKLWTKKGLEKQNNCLLNGNEFGIKYLAVGDGNGSIPNPTEDDTKLVNEVWRSEISELKQDGQKFTVTSFIPESAGDFIIREMGIFDENNELLFVAQMDETPKKASNTGLIKQIGLQAVFELKNGLNAVVVDPSIVTASTNYVSENYQKLSEKGAASGYASLDENGKVPENQLPITTSGLPLFCFNSGPVDENGEAALITIEGNIVTLNAPAVCTTASGKTYKIEENITLDISSLEEGNYNLFYAPETNELVAYANEIYTQKAQPADCNQNDIWVDTSVMPYLTKIKSETSFVQIDIVPNAVIAIVSGGGGKSLNNKAYNHFEDINNSYRVPIGRPIFCFNGECLEENEIWYEGAEVSKKSYAKVHAIVGDDFGTPENPDNFVLPDFRDKTIWGTFAGKLGYQEAEIPNVTGYFTSSTNIGGPFDGAGGACTLSQQVGTTYANGGGKTSYRQVSINASLISSIYKDGVTTIHPSAVMVRVKTRYK